MFFIECISGVDISPYSSNPGEAEILLLPGTCLKVVGSIPVSDAQIIQMQEIPVQGLVDFTRDQQKTTHK